MTFITQVEPTEDPREAFATWLPEGDGILLVPFTLSQYWLPGSPVIELKALYARLGGATQVAVTDRELRGGASSARGQWLHWQEELDCAVVLPGEPVALSPEYIPKPWGQEIWFTGVEERGVCCFTAGGGSTPIPWLQAVMPRNMLGQPGEGLVLLKVLDPTNEPVIGDLYFELHEEKREVYVVTHVDPAAWPDGQGYIRFGFAPEKVTAYNGEAAFREAYLEAVRDYEKVRRAIDALADGQLPSAEPTAQEEVLRRAMNDFTHMRALEVGDVVKVPLCFPHSLQHGVRTIEFQTPVYERKILSFAQQVLTQDHWDTAEAVERMTLAQVPAEEFEALGEGPGWREERIVDFPDFEVSRVHLMGGEYPLAARGSYRLVMAVSACLDLGGLRLDPEQACLVPEGWEGRVASSAGAGEQVFLCARPRS